MSAFPKQTLRKYERDRAEGLVVAVGSPTERSSGRGFAVAKDFSLVRLGCLES